MQREGTVCKASLEYAELQYDGFTFWQIAWTLRRGVKPKQPVP